MQHRRKPASAAAPAPAKQPPSRRPTARLSLAGLVVSVFLVATFLYNEDVVKASNNNSSSSSSISSGSTTSTVAAEVGVSGSGRARSPDLRVLQEAAAHQYHEVEVEVNARQRRQEQEDPKEKKQEEEEEEEQLVVVDTQKQKQQQQQPQQPPPPPQECDLYQGRWTFDAVGEQVPLYRESECQFLTEQVTCMRNGRRDDSYQKWRWQPAGCDLPRLVFPALPATATHTSKHTLSLQSSSSSSSDDPSSCDCFISFAAFNLIESLCLISSCVFAFLVGIGNWTKMDPNQAQALFPHFGWVGVGVESPIQTRGVDMRSMRLK